MKRFRTGGFLLAVATLLAASVMASERTGASGTQDGRLRRLTGRAGLTYVRVPPGEFWMGCVPADVRCDAHERPRHRVRLTYAYWIATMEVSVAAFREFVRDSGYATWAERQNKGRRFNVAADRWEWTPGLTWERPLHPDSVAPDDWPVVQVDTRDAAAFCGWAGGRLPTEAEWERAARADRAGEPFVWGRVPTPRVGSIAYANGPDARTKGAIPQWEVFEGYDDGHAMLAPVAQFAPNAFGLYDMAGNVYEWTSDSYDSTAYTSAGRVDPRSLRKETSRVVRGGSWGDYPHHLRSSFRGHFPEQGFPTATVGFRCVRDPGF